MLEFKTITRKWGNSIGITLPNEIVEKANIKPKKVLDVLILEKKVDLKKIFGTLNIKESGQKIKNEMRAGWNPEH